MPVELDYLGSIRAESERFVAAAARAEPATRVPTCPDWTAGDLLWHLAEVQWFWGTVVISGSLDRSEIDKVERPERPEDVPALIALFHDVSRRLVHALTQASPAAPVWTWSDDKTVGFVSRRQAHEALIHRVDAELVSSAQTPLDPTLAADGVDEVLSVMFGGDLPDWGTFEPSQGSTVRLRCTDTGDRWLAQLGTFRGTDPDDRTDYNEDVPQLLDDPDADAAAEVSGAAGDLDCWLWNRPLLGELRMSGDAPTLRRFETIVGRGID